ncbi:hypothetical protein BC941DRAFT_509776 [Chlamydoabsidia padenii]|nr:hypothetical protein BC941DRAFT_509776 [Chlamydoabsidia padenii]
MSLPFLPLKLTFLFKHCYSLVPLTLFLYFVFAISLIDAQVHQDDLAMRSYLLERALPTQISSTDISNQQDKNTHADSSINKNQASTRESTTSTEMDKPTGFSSPTDTLDNTGMATPTHTSTEYATDKSTATATATDHSTEEPTPTATNTSIKEPTETASETNDTTGSIIESTTTTYQSTDTTDSMATSTDSLATTDQYTFTATKSTSVTSTAETTTIRSMTTTQPTKSHTRMESPATTSSETKISTTEESTITTIETSSNMETTIASYSPTSSTTIAPYTMFSSTIMSTSETATTTTQDSSFSSTLYSTHTFSITSSTAVPSLVLGRNECGSDHHAIGGICPGDYFCNAALKTCVALKSNGDQCYEDFQCLSSYCGSGNVCTDAPSPSVLPATLTGGQIAGVTMGSIAGAVVLFLGLIRWQRRSRQLHLRAARFRDFEQEDHTKSARLSKYNFLTQALHGHHSTRMAEQSSMGYYHDIDDSQFYGTLAISPEPHQLGEVSSTHDLLGAHDPSPLDSVPREALTRTGPRTDHNPFKTQDQKIYGYF